MNTLIPPVLGIVGLIAAFVVYLLVMQYPDGEKKVKKIGDQIHSGALAFMKTEYKYLLIFIVILVGLVWLGLGIYSAIAVIVGAACSSLAGFIGMYAATKANVRTATAAKKFMIAAPLRTVTVAACAHHKPCLQNCRLLRSRLRPTHGGWPCLSTGASPSGQASQ